MILRAIDFETTGQPTEEDPHAVCEVGLCDIVFEEGRVVHIGEPWAMIVDPGRSMPPDSRAVHHISDDDTMFQPAITTGFMHIMGAMGGRPKPDYFVAHNADYEKSFFKGGETPWLCTFKIALRVWPDEDRHNLQYLRYKLDLQIDQAKGLPAHRAGPDAYVGAYLMAEILKHNTDFQRMGIWTRGRPLFRKVSFGKHKGLRYEEVPLDYLFWIRDKSDMSDDVKANAKYWIKQRAEAQ